MRKNIRRELFYLAACAAFGILALPGIIFVVVSPLVERGIVVPEIWPGSVEELYRGLYSAPLEDLKGGQFLQLCPLIAFYCLFPYLVFQVFRWAFRGIRFLWLRQHRI
jgi:hypothetical protein